MPCQRPGITGWCAKAWQGSDRERALKLLERKRLYNENFGYWIYRTGRHGIDAEF